MLRSAWKIGVCWLSLLVSEAVAQRDSRVPGPEYEAAFILYFDGDYPAALQAFRAAARSGVRSTDGVWVDSICYHAMMGECCYRMGNLPDALAQYNSALQVAMVHADWLLRVDIPAQITELNSSVRSTITWGATKRNTLLGRVPDRMLSFQGRLDNMEAYQRGGVVAAPQLYPLNAKEIVRCTAVALRRRREILGPVGRYDPLTSQVLSTFSNTATQPNHWSQAWAKCYAGLAYASAGKLEQAVPELTNSLLIGGQFDHELTALGLVELGKLAFEQGQYQAAANFFSEATFAAAAFSQFDVLEEAFRGAFLTHLVSGQKGVFTPLALAAEWSRRHSRALQAGLLLLAADSCASQGQMPQAVKLLAETRVAVGSRSMKAGVLGARFNYQSALVDFSLGNLTAGTNELTLAMNFQKLGSLRLFQIRMADDLYVKGASTITQRVADTLFSDVLREPTTADWSVDPCETLAVLLHPHPIPLEHWFEIALQRNDVEKALDISDRIRRQRFFSTLPLGGRLLALRWILEGPAAALSAAAKLQRQDLMSRFPNYASQSGQAAELRAALDALPLAPEGDDAKKQRRLFEQLAEVSTVQELILREIALRREASEFSFPPLLGVKDIQKQIPESQLVLAFLATSKTLTAFAISNEKSAMWPIDKPQETGKLVAELLRQLGPGDKKPTVGVTLLKDKTWQTTAAKLLKQLTASRIENWDPYQELVVVPDGLLWYVPFEALTTGDASNRQMLISKLRVRYAPTLGLINAELAGHKPDARTAVIVGKMTLGADPQTTATAFDELQHSLKQAARFDGLPAAANIFAATCDRLIVLSDLEANARGLYAWSPTALDRGRPGASLEDWMALPWQGPAELILPGFHTPAETGLRRTGNGNEVFMSVCGLMASGARSILISRWPVAGQSTFELIREYAQELPYSSAAEAWKRSVLLAADRRLNPDLEPRVDKASWDDNLKADHPFFWAGYMVVGNGSQPKSGEADPK